MSRSMSGPSVLDQEPPELPPMAEEIEQIGKRRNQSLMDALCVVSCSHPVNTSLNCPC